MSGSSSTTRIQLPADLDAHLARLGHHGGRLAHPHHDGEDRGLGLQHGRGQALGQGLDEGPLAGLGLGAHQLLHGPVVGGEAEVVARGGGADVALQADIHEDSLPARALGGGHAHLHAALDALEPDHVRHSLRA
jgi:hypothetical protein